MHVVAYRYPVSADAEQAFIELQRKVSAVYFAAGCRRYLLIKPVTSEGEWLEMSFYDSALAFETAENTVAKTGTLDELFTEFLRLTRTRESDLRPEFFEVVLGRDG